MVVHCCTSKVMQDICFHLSLIIAFYNILTLFETKQFKYTNIIFLKGKTYTGYLPYILSLIIPGLQPLNQTPKLWLKA